MTTAALAYFLLACAIAGGVTFVGVRSGRGVPTAFRALFTAVEERRTYMGLPVIVTTALRRPWVWVIVAFAIAPTVSGLVVAAIGGPLSVGDVLGSLAPIRDGADDGIRVYLVIAAIYVVGCVWYLRVSRAEVSAGTIAEPALLRDREGLDIAARLGVGPFVDEGGTLEELGWRGYLLPLLLLEVARGPATAVVAVLWWAWHLPREVTSIGRVPFGTWARGQGVFLLTCGGLSVLCTDAVMRTGGSVWPAIIIHGGTNVWSKALGAGPNRRVGTDARTVIVLGLAVVVMATWLL